jgi:hypothetical protein
MIIYLIKFCKLSRISFLNHDRFVPSSKYGLISQKKIGELERNNENNLVASNQMQTFVRMVVIIISYHDMPSPEKNLALDCERHCK